MQELLIYQQCTEGRYAMESIFQNLKHAWVYRCRRSRPASRQYSPDAERIRTVRAIGLILT